MAVAFRWQAILSGPPAPFVAVQIGPRIIAGLFDSGADFTHLRAEWQVRLGVANTACAPLQVTGVGGTISVVRYTMVDAILDGNSFKMPVCFSDQVPIDLFGRVGIFDQFEITHDPVMQATVFKWVGPQGRPWADVAEELWRNQLAQQHAGGRATPGTA